MAKKWKTCGTLLAGLKREIPRGKVGLFARSPLPAQIANQSTGFASSCLFSDSTMFKLHVI